MAEELTRILYDSSGINGMKKNEVLNVFQYRKTYNLTTPIALTLHCSDKRRGHDEDEEFSETAEMRSEILENMVHINHFAIFNFCTERNEHAAWFNYVHQILQIDHGGTKYVVQIYDHSSGDLVNYLSLEHATRLSNAIRLNNNGHIQSFTLNSLFMNTAAFQTIWNALLETGVPQVILSPQFLENKNRDGSKIVNTNNNNININFTGLSTNMSLKRLDFHQNFYAIDGNGLSQHNWRNLFFSIQGNTGLEKLKISFGSHMTVLKNTELLPCFTEMLQKNSTLIDVEANGIYDNDLKNEFTNVITIETKCNRKWNQYLMKRQEEEEGKASAITTPPPPLPAHLVTAAERKRRFKMGCLLVAFRNKAVMRDTILFHFLSETPDLWIDNNLQQNATQVFRN
eukprot:CAMPEP_0170758842 /NCGR_PEP_ID=MMETSP0733-20121128/566_1 /TAXON_ID=186038 /ORGANISM="Fragilariopsis kerguelensis, Strain L26-C5" /LENGTH=398 /DNA_ID=CAMNT_0011098211 /DNA_START=66 /DNA_END=1262 /DNA_ORIENTATION=-